MTAKLHITTITPIAITTVALIPNLFFSEIIIAGLAIGVLFPDIDEKNSYISRKLFILYWIIALLRQILSIALLIVYIFNKTLYERLKNITEHRGITHYLLFPVVLFLISFRLPTIAGLFVAAMAVGWLIHELGDACTYGGIEAWLFPFCTKTFWVLPRILRFRTGQSEAFIFLLFFLLDIFLTFHWGLVAKPASFL